MNNDAGMWVTSDEPRVSETVKLAASQNALKQIDLARRFAPRGKIDIRGLNIEAKSLFEQVPWLYAFCRERLFRDDTDLIGRALWPITKPAAGTKLVELGCGPGFYARRFAQRYPQISVVGVDRSDSQLAWARGRARNGKLRNCRFECVNVLAIPYADSYFDALIASRLFTVLPEREEVLAEMHRVLVPGGRCLITEPCHAFRASIPLIAMWMLARATQFGNGYREPHRAYVIKFEDFTHLCAAQPWKKSKCWQDGRYQYALCEKA